MTADEVDAVVRATLADVLALPAAQVARFGADTRLFGALPELDSMAVAGLLAELEDRLNIHVEDEEVSGDLFTTFGALRAYAESKTRR